MLKNPFDCAQFMCALSRLTHLATASDMTHPVGKDKRRQAHLFQSALEPTSLS